MPYFQASNDASSVLIVAAATNAEPFEGALFLPYRIERGAEPRSFAVVVVIGLCIIVGALSLPATTPPPLPRSLASLSFTAVFKVVVVVFFFAFFFIAAALLFFSPVFFLFLPSSSPFPPRCLFIDEMFLSFLEGMRERNNLATVSELSSFFSQSIAAERKTETNETSWRISSAVSLEDFSSAS